jgi:hypothetical protein
MMKAVHRNSDVSPGNREIILNSGNWEPRAECLGQSLDTYTPTPSNPSSTGALHPPPYDKRTEHGTAVYFQEWLRA